MFFNAFTRNRNHNRNHNHTYCRILKLFLCISMFFNGYHNRNRTKSRNFKLSSCIFLCCSLFPIVFEYVSAHVHNFGRVVALEGVPCNTLPNVANK